MFAPALCALTASVAEDAAKMKKTKKLTFCAMMVALSDVFLLLGGLTGVMELTGVVVGAAILFVVHRELKYSSVGVYLATAVIAFFLPFVGVTVASEYLVFAIYPILKPLFDKIPRVLRIVVKLLFMSVAIVGLMLILNAIVGVEVWYVNLAFCLGGIAIYFLFDILLTRFTPYYDYKLRHKLKIDRFFK